MFTEELHPREHGRFAPKDKAEPAPADVPYVIPAAASSPITPPTERALSPVASRESEAVKAAGAARIESYRAQGLFDHPVTGDHLTRGGGERSQLVQEAKMVAARDVQTRMTSSTEALWTAAFPDAKYGELPSGLDWSSSGGWSAFTVGANDVINNDYAVVDPARPDGSEISAEQYDAMVRDAAAASLIHEWAGTSNDESARSLAMQEAAQREFGLQGTAPWKMSDGTRSEVDALTGMRGDVYQDFVRAQYDSTQDLLDNAGVESVPLYRSMGVERNTENALIPERFDERAVELRPMSSFTTDASLASGWSNGGGVRLTLEGQVAADRIMGTPYSGVGCFGESEMVVLGGGDATFSGDHLGAAGDLGNIATDAVLEELTSAQQDGIVSPSWEIHDPVTMTGEGGNFVATAQDTYTGYNREITGQIDPATGEVTVDPLFGPGRLFNTTDLMERDAAAMREATANAPAGWKVELSGADQPGATLVVVSDSNGAWLNSTPYFTVDAGGGLSASTLERFVDSAVATQEHLIVATAIGNQVGVTIGNQTEPQPTQQNPTMTGYGDAPGTPYGSGSGYGTRMETTVDHAAGTVTATFTIAGGTGNDASFANPAVPPVTVTGSLADAYADPNNVDGQQFVTDSVAAFQQMANEYVMAQDNAAMAGT